MLRAMIRVTTYGPHIEQVVVSVDADDAAIVGPDKNTAGEDLLLLEKMGTEVAWFRVWAWATKQEGDVS